MATFGRLVRTARAWRGITSPKTLNPSPARSLDFLRRLHHRSFDRHIISAAPEFLQPKLLPNADHSYSIVPAILSALFGVGMLHVAYADSDQAAAKPSLPSESPSSYKDLEEIAKQERQRIEELLKSKGIKFGSYPRFTVAVKGQKVTIKFQIPPACDVPQLIANLVSNLGLKFDERGGGSDMLLRAWDSAVAWQLTLSCPEKQKKPDADTGYSADINIPEGDLCILIFRSLISTDKAEIEFIKGGSLSTKELDALVSVLQLAGGRLKISERKPGEGAARMPSAEKSVAALESMGVRIYGLDEPYVNSSNSGITWDNIAGYDQQKRDIEDTILLALHSPEVYDDIARGTRRKFESNRPRAVLFEGPPGTGKTSCARVIADQAGVPLLYVPLEVVMSKYYGESERLLGKVFSLANELPNGAIIFLDEVDSFAVARDSEMHEATRRILSVLLRQVKN
ncbi:hypothetical protein MANES_16G002800v8 [Manihot esculenta]|uniref:Uncharacterized protein n=1 Tax=Manihot esculenta TaxID=3983 RepID=A0ACB7G4G2_MANES|nr:hypothetical protein MANES_16G002800v8 [Manihot esculenta]